MSECLQAVVAAALAVQASAPIVLNRHLHWKFHMLIFIYLIFFCSLSLISILSAAWHLTQLHFYLRQRTDKNYGSQSWPTRYAFSRSWFNYCLLMVQANKPWTHSHYFHTIPHKQQNWFPWLRIHTCKDPVSLGNHKADKATNQAALQQPSDTYTIEELDLTILKDMLQYWAMVKTCLNKWG